MPRVYSMLAGRDIDISDAEYRRRIARNTPAAKNSVLADRIAAMQAQLAELLAEIERVPAAPALTIVPSNPAPQSDPEPLEQSNTHLRIHRDGSGRMKGASGELRTSEGAAPVSMTVGERGPDGRLREIVLDGPAGRVRAIMHRSAFGEDRLEIIAGGDA